MSFTEYQELILDITDGLKEVNYEYDGIYYEHTEKAEETEVYHNKDITETLSKHFSVIVTSVHADDSEYLGIWICYKED